MDVLDINTVLGVALGYVIAALVRYVQRSRFWALVTRRAMKHLQDPSDPIQTPEDAAAVALAESHSDRVAKVAAAISTTNGHSKEQ